MGKILRKFGNIRKIWTNTPVNSEKYSRKLGKIVRKVRKNTPQKPGSRSQNHFFQLCLQIRDLNHSYSLLTSFRHQYQCDPLVFTAKLIWQNKSSIKRLYIVQCIVVYCILFVFQIWANVRHSSHEACVAWISIRFFAAS